MDASLANPILSQIHKSQLKSATRGGFLTETSTCGLQEFTLQPLQSCSSIAKLF